MLQIIKRYLKKSNFVKWQYHNLKGILLKFRLRHGRLSIINDGTIKIRKVVSGGGNKLIVGKGTFLNNTVIHIIGNNNTIEFKEYCNVGPECSFWCEGDNIKIVIGAYTSFTVANHLNAQEDNSMIVIGEDCMISNHVIIRTSDSHPIYSLESKERINPAKDIHIGNHVWIAGFIGSHVVRLFVNKYPDYKIINLDKLTYAGNLANLKDIEDKPNYRFVKMDICDFDNVLKLMQTEKVDGIIHLAAESHVDRSIKDPFTFAHTNVMGTLSMLQAAKLYWESLPVRGQGDRYLDPYTI
jgi:hypothetical protein